MGMTVLSDSAPQIEKIKQKAVDLFDGMNMTGATMDYELYCECVETVWGCIKEAYELGKKEAERT